MKKALALAVGLVGISSVAQAATAPVQRIDVVNLLAHSKSSPGVTASPVTVKFFTAASTTTPCATATLAYDGATSIFAGTGLACTTAVTTITATVLAGPGSVIVYNDLASTALTGTGGRYSYQIEIMEGTTPPTFDANVGSVTTKGAVTVTQQASAE